MAQKWKRLPLPSNDTSPPLLFSFTPSSKGYDLFLTDLVHVWSESLNQKQILSRASKDDTSIDPSEDDDQFSVLLQKIGAALQSAKGSKLSLGLSTKENSLELTTSTPLPSPLEPLEWKLYLSMLPQNALTRQILVPILKGERERTARIQSLVDLLKEKDWALSKIFEKIESSGVDLSRAFPGLSGKAGDRRRGSAVSLVSKVIKGVAPFDEGEWNSRFTDQESGHDLGENIATELGGIHSDQDWELESSGGKWWTRLQTTAYTNEDPNIKKKERSKPVQQPVENEVTSGSDDEFQRQETPPQLKRTKPSSKQAAETTSESEDEPKAASPSSPVQDTKKASKGIGSIGSKPKRAPKPKQDEPTESESDEPELKRSWSKDDKKSKTLGSLGGGRGRTPQKQTAQSTASESSGSGEGKGVSQKKQPPDEDQTTSDSDGESPTQTPKKKQQSEAKINEDDNDDQRPLLVERKAPKSRAAGGIGKIGGKKRKESEERPPDKRPVSREEETSDTGDRKEKKTGKDKGASPAPASSSAAPKRGGKLGTIGGAKAARKEVDSQRNAPSRKPQPRDKDEETESGSEDGSAESKDEKKSRDEKPPDATTSRSRSPGTSAPPRRSAWPKEESKEKEEKEETPEERANRKREELRRRLETKGPAKKKRKF